VNDTTSIELKTVNEDLRDFYAPLALVLQRYAPIHALLKVEDKRPRELDGYLAIMQHISDRLLVAEPTSVADAKGAVPTTGLSGQLSDQLTPTGKLSLEVITQSKGSVDQMVDVWTTNHVLDTWLARPFKLPLRELRTAGLQDVQDVVKRVWKDEVQFSLDSILRKFPFDLQSNVEVTAEELELAFHPTRGLVFDRYRRFFSSVTSETPNEYRPLLHDFEVPPSLYPMLNRVARLSAALWDDEGKRRSIQLNIKSVPFDASDDMHAMLTLAYLNLGSASIFNFNQQPFMKTIEIDWGTPQTSQVGIQLTDVTTGQQYYPEALVTRDSYFSYLHLLKRAQTTRATNARERDLQGRELTEWRWTVSHGNRSVKNSQVRFMIAGDPMQLFNLRGVTYKPTPSVKVAPAVGATAARETREH
jgi:hypothetical protein